MFSLQRVMAPGRCSDPPDGTHKCGYVTAANFFCQFVVTVTISIGGRVLNFNFLRNKFTYVLSESLQLLNLVFTQCNASTYSSLYGIVKLTLLATNASRLTAGLFAYLAEMQAVVSVLSKHFYTYS